MPWPDESSRILQREIDLQRSRTESSRPAACGRRYGTTIASERAPRPIARRCKARRSRLPPLPTTTIGSFPQTTEVRKARARARRRAKCTSEDVRGTICRRRSTRTMRFQEEIGLDVLVHGEFERNDMVEYFGEQLEGFAFTDNGWVQSYGTRCVPPPIIFGDVVAPGADDGPLDRAMPNRSPSRPVKGMLTGPITMLQWSFVRDDQPRLDDLRQIALAIRDEVSGSERAGIGIIQIDEPALREGLPLRPLAMGRAYLGVGRGLPSALPAMRARDERQIHTHMCYSRVQRHHRGHRRVGCRRDLDRKCALRAGNALGLP